jgi:transketolase
VGFQPARERKTYGRQEACLTSMEAQLKDFARRLRIHALNMVHRAGAAHIGGALSMADLLASLYHPQHGRLRVDASDPAKPGRDRFVLSKGHSCVGLYAAIALAGFIDEAELETYAQDGSRLMSHVSHKVPGIEFSTGSLGHGLPFACGLALGAKRREESWRTVALVSDGELDEGSNWEAILFAGHHQLDNLWLIVDFNKIQSLGSVDQVLRLDPLGDKFKAFGWHVVEIDGNQVSQCHQALDLSKPHVGKPTVVIAHTKKGAGVEYMENKLLWHYRTPDKEQLATAIKQLV